MAHKKGGGSSRNGRDSAGKRLGVKAYGGQVGKAGQHHRAPARLEGPPGARTSARARTTPCSPRSAGRSRFARSRGKSVVSVLEGVLVEEATA